MIKKQTQKIGLALFIAFSLSFSVVAASKPRSITSVKRSRLLNFRDWKRLQVHKARTLFNKEKLSKNSNLKRSKALLSRLNYMKALSFEDYSSVYLSKFKDDPKALKVLASSMDNQEVLILLKKSLKKRN